MRDVARSFAARGNGHGAVCLFEGEDVVDAVARHGNGVALFFDGAHQDRLLFGRDASEHGVLVCHVLNFEIGEPVEGDVLTCVFDAHAARDFGHGHGVVARDDLDVHVVFAEPFDGFNGVRTDVVGKCDDRRGTEETRKPSARDGTGGIGEQQNAQSRCRILFDDLVDFGGHGPQDELGGAHGKGSRIAEGYGGKLALAGEGHGCGRLHDARVSEAVIKSNGSLIVVVEGGEHAAHNLLDGMIHKVVEDHHVVDGHSAVRDGARLVKTQNIDAGEHFEGVKILYEGLFFGEAHDADRHCKRGEKKQSRGDHADDDGARELNGEADVAARRAPVDVRHERRDDGDEDPDHADKQADGVHDLRLGLFVALCLGRERVKVGRLAHFIGAYAAGAAGDEGAGVQCFAGRFFDGDGFAR